MSQWNRLLSYGIIGLAMILGSPVRQTSAGGPEVFFSPNGGIPERILRSINLSRRTIDVAMFSFTSGELARALAAAHHRGVRVRILLDSDQVEDPNSEYRFLVDEGLTVRLLSGRPPRGILHDKFVIFDGREVATGSYNWTHSADRYNHENIVFFGDALANAFQKQFDKLWSIGRTGK